MDDIDRAQEREQQDRAIALSAARNAPTLPSTGACHWCDASVPEGAHFCDVDCRQDWEREISARRRAGLHK